MRMDMVPLSFISRTASTGSWVTSCVFAHDRGSVKVVEKTTFDNPAKAPVPGSPSLARPGHDPIGVCPNQDCVVPFRLISQPGEVIGLLPDPTSRASRQRPRIYRVR